MESTVFQEPAKARTKRSRKQRISELLAAIEDKITNQEMKATLADYIRLTQLERELDEDEPPREIKITWTQRRERSGTGK